MQLISAYIGELNHAIGLTKPRIIFAGSSSLDTILKVAQRNSSIEQIISFDDFKTNTNKVQHFRNFLNNPKSNVDQFKCKPVDISTNVVLVLYSSGTTGLPKGVELTQKNAMATISQN